MAQPTSGNYSIAWFKLAEFVARKEKERALGIYRLLAHSLHDDALVYQLEGDLLLSFNDLKALNAYTKAALLYQEQEKYAQAAALYEHMIALEPRFDYLYKLIGVYIRLQAEAKILKSLTALAVLIGRQDMYTELISNAAQALGACHIAYVADQCIGAMLEKEHYTLPGLQLCIEQAITGYHGIQEQALALLMDKLAPLPDMHRYACSYLEQIKR